MSGIDSLATNGIDPTTPERFADTDTVPAERDEACINCLKHWIDHAHWRCPGRSSKLPTNRMSLPHTHRYLTSDMLRATQPNAPMLPLVNDAPPPLPAVDETPTWKVWRDVNRDHLHCACGIFSGDCSYHRE